jgi:hypothetical protein
MLSVKPVPKVGKVKKSELNPLIQATLADIKELNEIIEAREKPSYEELLVQNSLTRMLEIQVRIMKELNWI